MWRAAGRMLLGGVSCLQAWREEKTGRCSQTVYRRHRWIPQQSIASDELCTATDAGTRGGSEWQEA